MNQYYNRKLKIYLVGGLLTILGISIALAYIIYWNSKNESYKLKNEYVFDYLLTKKNLIREDLYLVQGQSETLELLKSEFKNKNIIFNYQFTTQLKCNETQALNLGSHCLNYTIELIDHNRFIDGPFLGFVVIFIILVISYWYFIKYSIHEKIVKPLVSEIEKNSQDKAFNQLAEQVAHDLASPLLVINNLIQSNLKIENEELELLRFSLKRVNSTLNDLTPSSNEFKKHTPILKLFEQLILEKKLLHKKMTINLNSNITNENLCVNLEDGSLLRILSNLLNNSIEASHTEPIINVIIKEVESYALLIIEDKGIGIEESIIEKIGTREYSTKAGKKRGLALFHAKELIHNHGGDLDIYSSGKNQGTRITLKLKKIEVKEPDWKNYKKAILIDDDETIRAFWKLYAKKSKHLLSFDCFSSFKEFELAKIVPNEEMIILLDQNLDEQVKGDQLAEVLFKMGYKDIVIMTGEPEKVAMNPYIKLVTKKYFPF